jgi:uncharacterized membrane protein
MRIRAGVAVSVVLFAHTATASKLRSFDLPGQSAICGAAISDDGAVVGNTTGLATPIVNFMYQNGSFTILSPAVPAGLVGVTGINKTHVIAGTDTVVGANFNFTFSGFTLQGGTTQMLSLPGAVDVMARSINNAGVIVGSYQTSAGGPTLGFLKRGKRITTLNDGSNGVLPAGVNPTGTIVVGTSLSVGKFAGWSYSAGQFTPIVVPGALATAPMGVNLPGTIGGTYLTGTASASVSHGFLYNAGTFTLYDVPGASSTELTGINAHGQVTGCYTDSKGTHGLIYSPK